MRLGVLCTVIVASWCPPLGATDLAIPTVGAAVRTVSPHPHVDWQAVPAADRYRVQVAATADFAAPLIDDTVHAVIRWFVVARPLAPGRYHWRVRAETDDGAAGPWSTPEALEVVEPERTFDIDPATPAAEVARIAREAAAGPSARIRLAPGDYRWNPGFERAVFAWQGASDIVVEGRGARITIGDPAAQLFHLRGCRTIVIRDLEAGHEPCPYSAVEVVAVDPAGGWFDARVRAGFAEERYPREIQQCFVYATAGDDSLRKHPDRPGHTYLAWDKTVRGADDTFRYFPRDQVERGSLRQLQVGDRALVCYRRWPMNLMSGCRDIAWSGVRGGITEGPLVMGGDNTDIAYLGLVCSAHAPFFPSAPGWVTGGDRRGPWIENCLWEGLTDDGPNITGNAFLIDTVSADGEYAVSTGPGYQTPDWRAGDEIVFWNPLDGRPLAETTVTEAARDGSTIRFRAAAPVAGVAPGRDLREHTHVYNLSTQNHNLVIRGNRIVGGRRFGFNVKAVDALIDRNRFEGLASSAVFLENEPTGWEGLVNRGVVVQDNTITGCGFDAHSLRLGRAAIHVNTWRPGRGLEETDWQGNRDILIRRNTIEGWHGVAIGVDNVDGVEISGNEIRRPGARGAEPILVLPRAAGVSRP